MMEMVGHLVCWNCSGLISKPLDPENPPALIAGGGVCGPSCTCERDD